MGRLCLSWHRRVCQALQPTWRSRECAEGVKQLHSKRCQEEVINKDCKPHLPSPAVFRLLTHTLRLHPSGGLWRSQNPCNWNWEEICWVFDNTKLSKLLKQCLEAQVSDVLEISASYMICFYVAYYWSSAVWYFISIDNISLGILCKISHVEFHKYKENNTDVKVNYS